MAHFPEETVAAETTEETLSTMVGQVIFCKQPERDLTYGTDKLSSEGVQTSQELARILAKDDIRRAVSCQTARGRQALNIILAKKPTIITTNPILNPVGYEPTPELHKAELDSKTADLVTYLREQIQDLITQETGEGRFYITHSHLIEELLAKLIKPENVLAEVATTVGIFNPGQMWRLIMSRDQKTRAISFTIEHQKRTYQLSEEGHKLLGHAQPLSQR